MRRLPSATEEAILRRVLEGATYREVALESGACPSSVNRIVEDARKKMPEIDGLIKLSTMLRKCKLTVFDALRGAKLMENLNSCGVSLQELENYVRVTQKFLSEESLEEDFIIHAIRLLKLEQSCGKPYQQIIEDFDKKQTEVAELENRKTDMEKKNQELYEDTKKGEEHLVEVNSEIQKATTVRDGLLEIGLDNLARLVKFIRDFESLGFNVRRLQKLARTLEELRKIGVDPDTLDRFVGEKGPIEAQNSALKFDNKRLKDENVAFTQRNRDLLEENSVLGLLDRAWKTGTFTLRCITCGLPLTAPFKSREYYQGLTDSGRVLCL